VQDDPGALFAFGPGDAACWGTLDGVVAVAGFMVVGFMVFSLWVM
jgi:hypothetical protein